MAKKVLFVDDEPAILSIYEMLGSFIGDDCSVATASGGEEALRLMEEDRFDVIVSDLTMPGMSGIELLEKVAETYPATARVVVSGFTDEIMAAKCLMVGHRYFGKPFSPMTLSTALGSLCAAQGLAPNDRIREFVGKIEALPTLSRTYQELTRALGSNALPIREVSSVIERDPGLTAKVLNMVNSVAIAPAQRIGTVFDAVQLIGFGVVRALVMGIQVFELCGVTKTPLYESVWSHSLKTAVAAKRLAVGQGLAPEACDEAFFVGLLHDIGKVVLAASCPEYPKQWQAHGADSRALIAMETQCFGADHAQVGAYLLRLWGLPSATTQSVLTHHALGDAGIPEFNPLLAVHIAQELARAPSGETLDQNLLVRLDLAPRVPYWQAIMEHEAAKAAA